MKTKRLIVAVLASLLAVGAFAQDAKPQFKWYGFFRNYFTFDTRESTAGVEDFYYFMPKDVNYGLNGEDLNEGCSFRFAALTTRLGLDVTGYQYDRSSSCAHPLQGLHMPGGDEGWQHRLCR